MSSTFLRWGIPALLTVVGGTAAAVATSGAAIPDDLTQRSLIGLSDAERQWAQVHFDMQDAVITGTALTPEAIDAVVSKVAAIRGVREVRSEASVVASISPYPFVATVRNGKVTISGAVPDDDARDRLLGVAGQETTFDTKLLSGEGVRDRWLVAAAYVIDQALKLDEGEVALSDLDLTISGRARSQPDYQKLAEGAVAPPPDGVTIKFREVEAPVASPFEWQASFDGKTLSVSGFVPDAQFVPTLEALLPAGVTLNSTVQIASGQPADFARRALVLTQNLIRLREGRASLSDASSSLTGTPPDPKTAETVQTAVAIISADVKLETPLIENYHLRATRKADKLVLDGYVPSEADLAALRARADVDASAVTIGRGAPDRFADGLAFLLKTAGELSEGSVSLDGTVISMSGRAGSPEGYKAIQTSLGLGAPKGLLLGAIKVTQPALAEYTFSATKGPDGAVQLDGSMPSELIRRTLLAEVPGATDATGIADGAPDDFIDKARVALKALAGLTTGTVRLESGKWSVEGQVDRPDKATAARASLIAAGLESSAIRLSTSTPDVPVIAAYTWSATKAENGTVTVSGYWPDEVTQRSAIATVGGAVVDSASPGRGAPSGFAGATIAGLKALNLATSGSVALAGGNWTFDVTVASAPDRRQVNAALGALANDPQWHVAIQASDEPPLVSPFTWSAEKSADGSISLAGYVPDEALRSELAGSAGRLSKDSTLVGSGAPEGFAAHASAALDALSQLDSGRAGYDGNSWTISGTPPSADARDAAVAAIGGDASDDWTIALAEPPSITPVEEPAVAEGADAPAMPDEPAVAALDTPAETPAAEPAPQSPTAEPTQPEVDATAVAPEPAAATPPESAEVAVNVSRPFLFDARKEAGKAIRFEGQVPEEPVRAHLAELSGTKPSDALSVASDLPGDFLPSAEAGTKALSVLSDGVFGLDGTQWVFAGRAEGEEQRRQAMAALSTAPAASGWQTSITLVPPLELCQIKVGAFAQRNAILFQSGSAKLTPESQPALDELASDLQACTEATVNVEGHTDSDGNPDANLALSVARAEAVVNELILRGVDPARLYAIGYGATLPIASNDTKAGKQANRRIAFTLTDE